MGWKGMGEQDFPPFSERRSAEFEFVREHLPNEHAGFAVSAMIGLELQGIRPTRDRILERLRVSGRSSEQIVEKGWHE
jgi:hypothetical protein